MASVPFIQRDLSRCFWILPSKTARKSDFAKCRQNLYRRVPVPRVPSYVYLKLHTRSSKARELQPRVYTVGFSYHTEFSRSRTSLYAQTAHSHTLSRPWRVSLGPTPPSSLLLGRLAVSLTFCSRFHCPSRLHTLVGYKITAERRWLR
jgi:hypothetical protein